MLTVDVGPHEAEFLLFENAEVRPPSYIYLGWHAPATKKKVLKNFLNGVSRSIE
jgi:hypothetical protein